jgi:ferredoxin-NADP reductase/predicted pyridoxine 5'-phosphate oxidase superfamily flavin-nucleotide-binding protein
MARAFATIAFTPNVLAAQAQEGSRDAYQRALQGAVEPVALGRHEVAFIEARDSFYQGTVGETGWPYIQHRGGPPGFLKVLDGKTLGYADFSGNRQYISVGNLAGDDRISLFLMDYAAQRRLKIWGRARLINEDREPALLARLETPDFRARVERGVLITVEAFDWNCPKFITPRFTEQQVREVVSRWKGEQGDGPQPGGGEVLGRGGLELVITGMRQLTPRVRAYELRGRSGLELPAVSAGSHLVVPVRLPDGREVSRQYSLSGLPQRPDRYEIAVLKEESGRGASAAIHAGWQLGTRLAVDPPVNHFPLHGDDRPAVLIAGGIGITPLRAMAQSLKARGVSFRLHYTGRTADELAYREELLAEFPGQVQLYTTREAGGKRLELETTLAAAPSSAHFYLCGPTRLLEAAQRAARTCSIPLERVHVESFE